jgi:hypothetical protein
MAADGAGAAAATHVFLCDWDDEGVWLYQAFKDAIADWAVEHQRFGGPGFDPARMTWVKPSFAWVLYRSGYASKHNQTRVLKVKVSHAALAALLSGCQCKEGGGGAKGRVQWDPARDLSAAEGRVPRRMLRQRAIQIGLAGSLSELYVESVLRVVDVTDLALAVGAAHRERAPERVAALLSALPLPLERPYLPRCERGVLERLGMGGGAGGDGADADGAPTRSARRHGK